jgi:hypothetical protein
MFLIRIRPILGKVSAALFLLSFLATRPLAAQLAGPREQRSDNVRDIGVIDRALAAVKPGQKVVPFGDVGITPEQLRVFRQRLVTEQTGSSAENPPPDAVTPPGTTFKWPGGIVPFRFDPTQVGNGTITAAKMQQFRDGVAEWAAFANLHFNEFTGTPPPNFVTVQEAAALGEGGYSSSVGMAGGEQFVKFAPNSWNRGTICHEAGHTIGLWHEQQRNDRDTFVIIDWSNIAPANQPNFTKLPGTTAIGAYDFYSVMHYSRHAQAIDPNLDTITMQASYAQFADIIGNVFYRTLSKLDRAGMAVVYGNPSPLPSAVVTNTKDSGSGSLRAAIYYAFDKSTDIPPVPTAVLLNIPINDPGFANNVFTIQPTSLMVAPGAGTTIDGATQTAFTGDTNPNGPEVVLDGSQLAVQNLFAPGFYLREANCTLKNLVISGFNQQGVFIVGTGAIGNIVSGCYIGTNATGTSAMPNTFPGIEINQGANGNTIGGTTTAARNVISGNTHIGVSIHDSGTNGNIVEGNYIGLNATGTAAVPNTFEGVGVFLGAQRNVVGGTSTGARNVISGNASYGIAFSDLGTSNNIAEGNFIGLNAVGTAAQPNTFAGIAIFGHATNNIVGSSTNAGGRNIISGNSAQGITISDAGTNSNKVQGNIIGLNPAGTAALGNQGGGIDIFGGGSSNTIGGPSAVSSNFISGNVGAGINISGVGTKNNMGQHNFVGTNLTGTAVPNNAGIRIFGGAQSNTIGGTSVSSRNVISGNNYQGVAISGTGTKSNKVVGNFIGTNNAGTVALPNAAAGVSIFGAAQSNVIGGPTAASRNVISGNQNQGVTISDSGTSRNQILSNFIGTNAAGTAALANSWSGIDIFLAAASNMIGGPGKGNVISGNGNYGISFNGIGTKLNTVQGNFIGLNAAGTGGIANSWSGVILSSGAQTNFIGNSAVGAGNMIAFNGNWGIVVFDSTTTGNDFNANSIFSNSYLGIDLGGDGVTPNDPQDPDTGPNGLQNFPVLTFANTAAVIQGSLNSIPNKLLRIDFFSSPVADPSGFGEGQTWIGALNVTTDGSGNASFNMQFSGSLAAGSVVTATATGTDGASGKSGTSEFSAAITVVP